MVRLRILSGKMAGAEVAARHFPFKIGRGTTEDLQLPDPGVFDHHLVIELSPSHALELTAAPGAATQVNGARVASVALRNGDVIEAGGAKFQFWIASAPRKSESAREILTWLGLALLSAAQVALIYWLSR